MAKFDKKAKQLKDAALAQAAVHGRLVAADLIHAIKTERSAQIMLAMLVVCIVFWNVPLMSALLYPFKLFVTMIHESAHVVAARLTGGNIASMSIAADESGLTMSVGGFRPLVASAGYLGTSLFGAVMIWIGRSPESARVVLKYLGWTLMMITIFYGGGGFFSLISMALISAGIMYVSRKASDNTCHMLLLMLAVICTIEAALDFRILMSVSMIADAPSDARSMAMLTGIPRTIWTIFFGLFSLIVLFLSFWLRYRPVSQKAIAAEKETARDLGHE